MATMLGYMCTQPGLASTALKYRVDAMTTYINSHLGRVLRNFKLDINKLCRAD